MVVTEVSPPQNLPESRIENGQIWPRGAIAATEHGTLIEHFGKYLGELIMDTGGPYGPIGVQYVINPLIRFVHIPGGVRDPLHESEHEVTPGLVYNYQGGVNPDGTYQYGRGLATITTYCAAYCSFCTRGDVVGKARGKYLVDDDRPRTLATKNQLTFAEVDQIFEFYRTEPWIDEIIISGGDFMLAQQELFEYVVNGLVRLQDETKYNPYLQKIVPALSIIRIGTRLPLQNPNLVEDERIEMLKPLHNLNLMFHGNNSAELTQKALSAIDKFRDIRGVTLYSQSVLLRGVNALLKPGYEQNIHEQELEYEVRQGPDGNKYRVPVTDHSIDETATVQTLMNMYHALKVNGIVPYYLFQNDAVQWAQLLTVPPPQAIRLTNRILSRLSGLANKAEFVFDNGNGKVHAKMLDPDAAGYTDWRGNFVPWGELITE
ncbi:TPA: hypothetical protein DIV55_02800 [Patescibacteria group bacterium]|uniref:L-lysine 2,3-aminomutase n=1 Tax=Candidatus Gottesmanbacteria bacterium GW2011_GWA1_43_11 TaxID=1618436 RepID=A0A0G1FDJ6_9BACT|nr:MAG: L-lysine 2,3-aminomutase [Candidatus Gottesmanbacteria bacterium GW2011_GWA1_43_11]HCS78649.1 hypothetical protein [Patescibacteria group bacterium]